MPEIIAKATKINYLDPVSSQPVCKDYIEFILPVPAKDLDGKDIYIKSQPVRMTIDEIDSQIATLQSQVDLLKQMKTTAQTTIKAVEPIK